MQLIQKYIVNNDCYKNNLNKADSRYTLFQQRGPQGLVLHSVGCAQPKALAFANAWNVPDKEVAVHGVLQADGTVYQCMPWNFRGWHVGGSANNTHLGVEMTEPASLKYGRGGKFTCSDIPGAREFVQGCYDTAVELFATLCKEWNLDPTKDGVILSHKECSQRGIGSNHGDPEHLWNGLGMDLNMNKFRAAVSAKLNEMNKEEEEMTEARVKEIFNEMIGEAIKPALAAASAAAQSASQAASSAQICANSMSAVQALQAAVNEIKESSSTRVYKYLKDVTQKWYRPTLDKLIEYKFLTGKGGKGENTIIDLTEDSIRVLVYLDRAGVWDMMHNNGWVEA